MSIKNHGWAHGAYGCVLCVLLAAYAQAQHSESTIGRIVTDNARVSMDAAVRSVWGRDDYAQYVVGLDYHKIWSVNQRDIGVLTIQPYVVNFAGKMATPYFFDGRDTELTWRITNFNYMMLPSGALRIRVGHFEIPFGLEQNADTNGTLRQYSASADRGIKADWGGTINGVLPHWEYEFALSRGSGNDISSRDNPLVLSGRIGSASHRNWIVGGSFFEGRVQTPTSAIRRKRIGVDASYYYRHWGILGEASYGDDAGFRREHYLIEFSWRNALESIQLYSQYHVQNKERSTVNIKNQSQRLTIGVEWALGRRFSINAQWWEPTNTATSVNPPSEFAAQLRYRL